MISTWCKQSNNVAAISQELKEYNVMQMFHDPFENNIMHAWLLGLAVANELVIIMDACV